MREWISKIMSRFKYKALDPNGETVKGHIDAASEDEAFAQLRSRRLDVFQISTMAAPTRLFQSAGTPKRRDMARYIRQLATLLSAGVALLEALASLSRSNAHPALAKASDNIRKNLRSGDRLSVAMERHLPGLPRYVPRLAELGEATGQSAKALSDAADRMEFEDAMRAEVRTALSYPLFLTVVGGLIVFLLFLFVVPRFDALIGDNRASLPAISKFVIGFGAGLRDNIVPTLIGFGVITGLLVVVTQNAELRARLRSWAETVPWVGPLLVQAELGGWARTVGIALDNGADLLSALGLGEFGLRSQRLRRGMKAARTEIRAGRNIDDVLAEAVPDFDPLTIDLIRTGRTSGGLADMLLFVGRTQEKETRETAKRLAALAEPLAISIISLIVGTVVISIVLAMTSLYDFGL